MKMVNLPNDTLQFDSERYHVLDAICEHISIMDKDLNILWANRMAKRYFGKDLVGKKCYQAFHQLDQPCDPTPCLTLKVFQDGQTHEHETEVIGKDGQKIIFHCKANPLEFGPDGKPISVIELSRDITQQRLAEAALRELEENLKDRVIECTQELDTKNVQLKETNTALNVLAQNLRKEKETLQENFLVSLKEHVTPYFEQLKRTQLNGRQKMLMETIEGQMKEITSAFSFRSNFNHARLTAQEQRIADLVRLGRTSKEISDVLSISSHTVDTHRRNIRKKLGFNGGPQNLRSYLMNTN